LKGTEERSKGGQDERHDDDDPGGFRGPAQQPGRLHAGRPPHADGPQDAQEGPYENIANNAKERRGEERDFEAEPLPWGQHAGRFFIEHKGNLYLKFFPTKSGCKGEDRWEIDGIEVDLTVIKPFLPKARPNKSGTPWRTIALNSIEEITLDGETIALKG